MDEEVVFNVLSDSTRRLIIKELVERSEQTLFELCARLTMKHNVNMSRQAIVKHLDLLEKAGIVNSEFRGKYRVLRFNKLPMEEVLKRWINISGQN